MLLFDEIEKASPKIHRLLLGLLDEGRIRSGSGRRLDTRQCVVVMTTNAITEAGLIQHPIGFSNPGKVPAPMDRLAGHFPREFLRRLDEILVFNNLGIRQLRMREILEHLGEQGVILCFDEHRFLNYLSDDLQVLSSGARSIARLLDTRLLQPLSRVLLRHHCGFPVKVLLKNAFCRDGSLSIAQAAGRPVRRQQNPESGPFHYKSAKFTLLTKCPLAVIKFRQRVTL